MKKLVLKAGFILTAAEVAFLSGLAVNGPTTKLTATEVRQVSNIYYRLFGGGDDRLIEIASKTKWPGGERKKTHEAQREILDKLAQTSSVLTMHDPNEHLLLLLGTVSLFGTHPLSVAIAGTALDIEDVPPAMTNGPRSAINITINGQARIVDLDEEMTYGKLRGMAGYEDNVVVEIDYKHPGDTADTLHPGQETFAQEGSDFIVRLPEQA